MRSRDIPVLIIKHLMLRPHTSLEIQRSTGISEQTTGRWLQDFADQGLAYPTQMPRTERPGRSAALWHWNHAGPFAHLEDK